MTTRPILAALLGTLVACPPSVCAQTPDTTAATNAEIERLHGEGVAFFKARRYREAMARFDAARKLLPDPTLTYNIGRCQEALGDLDAARASYRATAEDASADVALRAKAKARASAVETALAAAAQISKTPPARPVAPPSAAVLAPATAAPAPALTTPPPATDSDALEWTLIGVGGAAVVAGAVVGFLGVQDHGELDDAVSGDRGSLTRVRALELDADGRDKKVWGAALGGFGLAAATVGVVMLLTDDGPAVDGEVRTSLVPQLDQPGLSFGMEF